MNSPKTTIIDVALKAGVSKGTVDRVIHNRGYVSPESRTRVDQAIEELGYRPNMYASLLSRKSDKTIAILIPKATKDEYWGLIYEGLMMSESGLNSIGFVIRTFYYDQYDENSFKEATSKLLGSNPAGVIFPPLFKETSFELAKRLHESGIPYVYVDTKIEEDGHYLSYYGMPMYKSGQLCASLLTEHCRPEDLKQVAAIRIIRDSSGKADPTVLRREGFNDYIEEHFPSCEILNFFIDPKDPSKIDERMELFFSQHPNIKHMAMFNSRIHLVKGYLESHPDPERRVIGFDNLRKNLEMLSNGSVDKLISQQSMLWGRLAANNLTNFILKQNVHERTDNYVHMDILSKLNIDNY